VVSDAVQRFGFAATHPAIVAIRKFVVEWKKKPAAIIGAGDLAAFLEYMDWFQQAQGCVEAEDAPGHDLSTPRLMSAHAAKGLEFEHVFVLRVNSGSFPTGYRERLFEFPEALRKGVRAQGDSSDVHRQEERRLFYVAMTRARESLTVCARPGRGKQRRPSGFARELLEDRGTRPFRREVSITPPAQRGLDLAASAGAGITAWLLMPPSVRLQSPVLSATAIEMYEKCPLHFKLERDWKIPGAQAAAMQYGNVVHAVMKDFYDALRAERPRILEQTLALFRELLAEAYFDDEHQRELYRRQGEKQLAEFLAARAQEPPPAVEKTEWSFEVKIADVPVRGRVDRIDRIADGIAVIDYKTGKARKQRDADESLQLSLYAIATELQLGQRPGQLIIYNLEDSSALVTSRNDAALEEARQRVQAAAEGIAAGEFEPSPDRFNCRWCEYRNLCPATEQKLYMNGGVN
jgi:DNA helicase II / ATP-dependent DNA helicase PcrA